MQGAGCGVAVVEKNPKKLMDAREKAMRTVQYALDGRAKDLVVLEMGGVSSFADYFVICSGNSSRQVQGIADRVEEGLRESGIRPMGVEGRREGHWVLIDYGDVIVHVFHEPTRFFYDLESLWFEAKRVPLENREPLGSTAGE
jgi:ribosome-associated protein